MNAAEEVLSGPRDEVVGQAVVQAARLVRTGKVFSLARARFPGMPIFPGHPPFQVISYRTPHGLRVAGENLWSPVPNEAQLASAAFRGRTTGAGGRAHSGKGQTRADLTSRTVPGILEC